MLKIDNILPGFLTEQTPPIKYCGDPYIICHILFGQNEFFWLEFRCRAGNVGSRESTFYQIFKLFCVGAMWNNNNTFIIYKKCRLKAHIILRIHIQVAAEIALLKLSKR